MLRHNFFQIILARLLTLFLHFFLYPRCFRLDYLVDASHVYLKFFLLHELLLIKFLTFFDVHLLHSFCLLFSFFN